jgi:hypothetical protein
MTRHDGPTDPCQRTTDPRCAAAGPHPGARHSDPADDLYDGPDTAIQALPGRISGHVRTLLALLPDTVPARVALRGVIDALDAADRAVGHARADRDRGIHEALAAAGGCETHRQQIADLEAQARHDARRADRIDQARTLLVTALHEIRDRAPEPYATACRRALAAHGRVWRQ